MYIAGTGLPLLSSRMQRSSISYRETGRFTPLVSDYLEGDVVFEPLTAFPFSRRGLEKAATDRQFETGAREILCVALDRQYTDVPMHPRVRASLAALKKPSTLTVTTGHQLCLFTGPLYFPIKVLNAIRLARELSTAERHVVPVFWMASEDHDNAEVDHAWVFGKKIHWPGESGPPMGRVPLTGIGEVMAELDALLGAGEHADELRAMLHMSYRPGSTLAQATRLFVNALFGRYGLVVLDGDNPDLKRRFAPVMKEELLEQVVQKEIAKTDAILAPRHAVQAHAREINLFHLSDRLRARIEKLGDRYRVLDGGTEYSTEELLDTLDDRPQVFSPNVLLRPVYQELVLPNVAYVGGGAEVAYWLQLKPVFERFNVPMPTVVLRTSAILLSAREQERMKKLGLSNADLFAPLEELRQRIARSTSTIDTDLSAERRKMDTFHQELADRVRAIDPSLEATVKADAHKAEKTLDHLEQKLLRVAKREQELPLQRLDKFHATLFPDGALHERRENFIPYYLQYGPAFFDHLLEALDPLERAFTILELDQ